MQLGEYVQAEPYGYSSDQISQFRELHAWRAKNYVNEADPLRILHFMRLLKEINDLPSGDYIEMGTQYGGTAKLIHDLMRRECKLYCFDTFKGFDEGDLAIETTVGAHGFTTESIAPLAPEKVRHEITGGLPSDRLFLVPGRVPHSLAPYEHMTWRFAHLDMDLYEPTKRGLEWLWPRMVAGAMLFFHDYDALPPVRKAVDEFLRPRGLLATPVNDRFGSAVAFKPPAASVYEHRSMPVDRLASALRRLYISTKVG